MGQKQDTLCELLEGEGSLDQHRRPNAADRARAGLLEDAVDLYRGLGGILPVMPTRAGKWDAVFEGVAVELDEQLHFNRYRLRTLGARPYDRLLNFPRHRYQAFCRDHEPACLKAGSYGGKWSNRSCERQFGPPGAPGDLSGAGAPRWKQRAFYDFLKDLAPLALDLPVARLSIWERLPGDQMRRRIQECLRRPSPETATQIVAFIRLRALSPTP